MAVNEGQGERKVEVAVVTTSGSWPASGFNGVPERQPVKHELEEAARHLGIVNTSGWIATVNGRQINTDASYLENGLSGQITIDFGPREGGGGKR
jgi:hypothetical protein